MGKTRCGIGDPLSLKTPLRTMGRRKIPEKTRKNIPKTIPSLEETIEIFINNKDFMKEYRRLTGSALGVGIPINIMVDEASGKFDADAKELFEFIRDYVWRYVSWKIFIDPIMESFLEGEVDGWIRREEPEREP